jgi:hypothetical protein
VASQLVASQVVLSSIQLVTFVTNSASESILLLVRGLTLDEGLHILIIQGIMKSGNKSLREVLNQSLSSEGIRRRIYC